MAAPTTTTTTTGQSIPNFVEDDEGRRRHHHNHSRVSNLTKLIDVELDFLMESFEEAKRRIDPMISQINKARNKFDQLRKQREGGNIIMETVITELQELKQTTSKLKTKIPFILIAPEYQPAADPNVIFQPRSDDSRKPTSDNPAIVVDELVDYNHPPIPVTEQDMDLYFGIDEILVLSCFLAFPEGAFIKASLLCSFLNATGRLYSLEDTVSVVDDLVSNGLIKSVYKKHCTTIPSGFWIDPCHYPIINNHLSNTVPHGRPQSLVNSINGENIINNGSADPSTMPSDLMLLHLGRWQSSPTHHVEMPDPDLYFKHLTEDDMRSSLRYISFRGVSVMKELPNFVTHILKLRILDLKACHHLEVIPSNIGNLSSLTHLDMSECYFLDHMPTSLSQLTNLYVLKGFFVGETNNVESCTLQGLSSLTRLMKLNIHTGVQTFPSEDQLTILQGFKDLRNLTICWGGSSTRNENRELKRQKTSTIRLTSLFTRVADPAVGVKEFSFNLEKLDLRGVPEKGTRNWFNPSNFEKLEKLYIRGGLLNDLRHIKEAQKDKGSAAVKENAWSVKTLRLRHLSNMQMDWSELRNSFPNLVSVEKVGCPNLTSFPCDDSGFWARDTAQPRATSSL